MASGVQVDGQVPQQMAAAKSSCDHGVRNQPGNQWWCIVVGGQRLGCLLVDWWGHIRPTRRGYSLCGAVNGTWVGGLGQEWEREIGQWGLMWLCEGVVALDLVLVWVWVWALLWLGWQWWCGHCVQEVVSLCHGCLQLTIVVELLEVSWLGEVQSFFNGESQEVVGWVDSILVCGLLSEFLLPVVGVGQLFQWHHL